MHGDAVQCDIAARVLKSVHVVEAEEGITLQGNLLQTSCTNATTKSQDKAPCVTS